MKRITTQTELAEACGVTKNQISMIMSGKTNASYDTAVKIYKAIGGGVLLWMNPKRVDERIETFNKYKEKTK